MPKVSRVGIDGDALRKPLSGVGQYVFNLCRELDQLLPETEFFIYTRLAPEQLALPASRWQVRRERVAVARKIPSFLWLKTRGVALASKDKLDVFWAGRTIHPGLKAAGHIAITVHDLNHRLVPKTMERATRYSHQLWFEQDVRSAHTVFSNSQGTSERLAHWAGRGADVVVHPGINRHFRPFSVSEQQAAIPELAKLGIKPPYILAVSTLEPRKNMAVLIDAFVQLKAAGELTQHQLVLVGARGWQNQALGQKIQNHQSLGIILPGYVPDELMPSVFALAKVLVMPSLYEGFGMPVVEARAVHTPVIIADMPELKEAAAGQGQVIQPDVSGIKAALLATLVNPNNQSAVQQDTAPSSWQDSAKQMVAALSQHQPLRE